MTIVRVRVELRRLKEMQYMADEASIHGSFARRGNENPRIRTLDSLYYDYARIK